MCAGAGTSVSLRSSVNSSNHFGRYRNRSPEARLLSLFFTICFGFFFGESRQFPGVGSSLRSVAGLEDVLDECCGGDVEDELVPGFDDNPGTRRGTKFSVFAVELLPLFGQVWHLTAGTLMQLQACHRVFAPSRRDQDRERVLVFLVRLNFSIGRYQSCGVPGSPQS